MVTYRVFDTALDKGEFFNSLSAAVAHLSKNRGGWVWYVTNINKIALGIEKSRDKMYIPLDEDFILYIW